MLLIKTYKNHIANKGKSPHFITKYIVIIISFQQVLTKNTMLVFNSKHKCTTSTILHIMHHSPNSSVMLGKLSYIRLIKNDQNEEFLAIGLKLFYSTFVLMITLG